MKTLSRRWAVVALIGLVVPLTNCISPDSGTESGTVVDITNPPPPNPDSYACDPFDGDVNADGDQGILSNFYYLSDDQPRYGRVSDYIEFGHPVEDVLLYLNQVFVPTRPFDRGFTTASGQTITNGNGTTLYEYFALRMRGRIVRANLPAGPYQFALLADDGAVLDMDLGAGLVRVVDNDGTHSTKMACASVPVELGVGAIPFQLDYYQGPRYHISVVLMARPWPADNNWADVECGRSGNSRYFDSTQNPPAPMAAYNGLLSRGWAPLEQQNYYLPVASQPNPCNVPAPVISNFRIVSFTNNSVTVAWDTDIQAKSQVSIYVTGTSNVQLTAESAGYATAHNVVVTGLMANTTYALKGMAKSSSGLSSESAELTVRTRR